MKKIIGWASASMLVAIVAAGCTTSTDDTSEGGAGSAGSSGAGGGTDTDGSTPPIDTDAGNEAMPATTDTPCGMCAQDKCATDLAACTAQTDGCATGLSGFYACLAAPGSDGDSCVTAFAMDASGAEGGGGLANDLGACVADPDTSKGCLTICQGSTDGGAE